MVFLVRLRKRVTYIQKFLARGSYRNNCFITAQRDLDRGRATQLSMRFHAHIGLALWDGDDISVDVLQFQLLIRYFSPQIRDEVMFQHRNSQSLR